MQRVKADRYLAQKKSIGVCEVGRVQCDQSEKIANSLGNPIASSLLLSAPCRLDEEMHKREDAENNLVLFRKVSKLIRWVAHSALSCPLMHTCRLIRCVIHRWHTLRISFLRHPFGLTKVYIFIPICLLLCQGLRLNFEWHFWQPLVRSIALN